MTEAPATAPVTLRAKVETAREFAEQFYILSCCQGEHRFKALGTLPVTGDVTGMVFSLSGQWDIHPVHGRQFRFSACSMEGSEVWFFLAKMVKGIGESLATALLATYGEDELVRVLDLEPEVLLNFPGIKEKKLAAISASWERYKPLLELSRYLSPYGVSTALVVKLFNHFEAGALELIKANPYAITEVHGIGFKTADELALKLGVDPHAPERLDSCIEYCLKQRGENDGTTLVGERQLIADLRFELDLAAGGVHLTDAEIRDRIDQLLFVQRLVAVGDELAHCDYYRCETRIRDILAARLARPAMPVLAEADLPAFLARMTSELGVPGFAPEQARAIALTAAGYATLIVCGYAGTGKSTIARAMLTLLAEQYGGDEVLCMALSGIAADRIRTTTGFPAATIHGALGWNGRGFDYGPDKRLPCKVVLLDESSMVNAQLMRGVLEALPADGVFIMLGDNAQLPPIGAGDVFADLIASRQLPLVELTEIFRQSADSVLVTFANEVRQGGVPEAFTAPDYRDFRFISHSIPDYFRLKNTLLPQELEAVQQQNLAEILELVKNRIRAAAAIVVDPVTDFQILTPVHKTLLGTASLNRVAQEILNPGEYGGKVLPAAGVVFKPGDKVVHTRNKDMLALDEAGFAASPERFGELAKSRRIFNGNVGLVVTVDPEERQLFVRYSPGVIVRYEALQLGEFVSHAFALSVHKAQGCEYENVLMPIVMAHANMLNAKWLYTALTRAKRRAVLVGQDYAFRLAAKKLKNIRRHTVLGALLKQPLLLQERQPELDFQPV